MPMFNDDNLRLIASFLDGIGIPVVPCTLDRETFLPGILVDCGTLRVDEEKLLSPGDLLHEAGHIALMSPAERSEIVDSAGDELGMEIGAIAWSWAALVHLGLPPEIVFHEEGYRGSSKAFIENFSQGRYVGVPILSWLDMACEPSRIGPIREESFPHMIRWLRE